MASSPGMSARASSSDQRSGRSSPRRRRTRRSRSHARWAGRAAARPQSKLRCGGGERATFGSGGARKYGCDQTGCGGLSVVEQPASLIGALNSPHDKSADERQSLETKPISRGTESSNPVPSSAESATNHGRGPGDVSKAQPAFAAVAVDRLASTRRAGSDCRAGRRAELMRPANSSPSQTTGCLFLCFNIRESKRAEDPSRVSVGNLIPEAVGDIARRLGERLLPSHHLGE